MAMDDNGGILTMISDLVTDTVSEQSVKERKSNTVAAIIGGVITMLISGAAYLAEHETNLPSWFPLVATLLGVLGTALKINKTANGVTPSVADKLQDKLVQKVDLKHFDEMSSGVVQTVQSAAQRYPVDFQAHPFEVADNLRKAAEDIVRNATAPR